MAETVFEPWSFRSPSKYCNHKATEADISVIGNLMQAT